MDLFGAASKADSSLDGLSWESLCDGDGNFDIQCIILATKGQNFSFVPSTSAEDDLAIYSSTGKLEGILRVSGKTRDSGHAYCLICNPNNHLDWVCKDSLEKSPYEVPYKIIKDEVRKSGTWFLFRGKEFNESSLKTLYLHNAPFQNRSECVNYVLASFM